MSLTAQVAPNYQQAIKEQSQANAALPAGPYEVTVAKAEVVPFRRNGGNCGGKHALSVQLRVADGGERAGRFIFGRIPLFSHWNPSAKYPDGYPIREYGQFFKAVGATQDQINSGQLPGLDQILGKRLAIKLKFITPEDQPDRAEFHENEDGDQMPWNEIGHWAASAVKAGSSGPAVSADVWGAAPAAAAPSTNPADQPWNPTGPSL